MKAIVNNCSLNTIVNNLRKCYKHFLVWLTSKVHTTFKIILSGSTLNLQNSRMKVNSRIGTGTFLYLFH